MFRSLGNLVSRGWWVLLIVWIGLLAGLLSIRPAWDDVVEDGEFAFLPEDAPSRQGENLYREAWDTPLASNVVLVVSRNTQLRDEDFDFIDDVLQPELEGIADREFRKMLAGGGLESAKPASEDAGASDSAAVSDDESSSDGGESGEEDAEVASTDEGEETAEDIKGPVVRTYTDKSVGRFLKSRDKKSTLVVVDLTTEFLDKRNRGLVGAIETLTDRDGEFQRREGFPTGLHIAISGSATVGRDMTVAAEESSSATELWTVLLVVGLLIAIYRAPILALIPLITVAVSVEIALSVLALLADWGSLSLFRDIKVYVTILSYGAGVDYCLFLIARYKEELDDGNDFHIASTNALAKTGAALTASAGTVMVGIGMMVFAEFGKFQQAGYGITLGLVIVLAASLTFSPALLRLFGRWAFWPRVPGAASSTVGWISPTSFIGRMLEQDLIQSFWVRVGALLVRRPGTVLSASILLMLPFAVIGVVYYTYLSYGLLSELPVDNASVRGAAAIQEHFDPGIAGPVTVLLKATDYDFSSDDESGDAVDDSGDVDRANYGFNSEAGKKVIRELTAKLADKKEELALVDIRDYANPFGITEAAIDEEKPNFIEFRIRAQRVKEHYVSQSPTQQGIVTRIDCILRDDPFSRDSIRQFENLKATIAEFAPKGIDVLTIGATSSIADLKEVTDRDQIRIDVLVLAGVFVILVILLRRPAISMYLIVSVFFSYLVTLGVTFALFWAMAGGDFAGLDWKVPMFLFTILIAVGEDYNIFLMTRMGEEQAQHGLIDGITVSLNKTGSIISSCGIIMAGTFSSLLAGSLAGLHQLGFALAFGVLLDTFVVRPVLVPAYLILLHQGRFGALGKLLGEGQYLPTGIHGAEEEPAESGASSATTATSESQSESENESEQEQVDATETA